MNHVWLPNEHKCALRKDFGVEGLTRPKSSLGTIWEPFLVRERESYCVMQASSLSHEGDLDYGQKGCVGKAWEDGRPC